jgi:site-specific recombinase XerD
MLSRQRQIARVWIKVEMNSTASSYCMSCANHTKPKSPRVQRALVTLMTGATMHEVREFAGHADIRTTESL